ncbi:S-adenosyl-L-methionine-dependent methyltransferase superfamily protein [Zea mays]|uniref:Calmodulin-lysine N-methyltransferase n=1 Tax=Zea mays TaxID=4577 RepID=A0A1D6PF09_MAIZE|nr:S-adenosyl-L-methionine-dependent methyltransferase superfamily protein [Zea mays]
MELRKMMTLTNTVQDDDTEQQDDAASQEDDEEEEHPLQSDGRSMEGEESVLGGVGGSKKVLELGSGYGLAGLVIAASTNADEVVISDGNPQVAEYIQKNISINAETFGETKVKSLILHWDKEQASEMLNTFDIIVASDCTFFKQFHKGLARTVKSLLKHSATSQAIFLSPKRGDSLDKFLGIIKENGLSCELIENYDPTVWNLHKKLVAGEDRTWPNYDKEHCYPLLVRIGYFSEF